MEMTVTAETPQSTESTVISESGQSSNGFGMEDFLNRDSQFYTGNSKAPEKKESTPAKPTATPPKEEAVKTQEKAQEAKEGDPNKEPETAEKRLKDKDRYITKLEEERKELKLSIAKLNKLINKYGSDALVYDENGDPVGFNFETKNEKPKKEEESDPEPPKPSPDDDLETYNEKIEARVLWKIRQEKKAEAEKQRIEQEEKSKKEEEDYRTQVFNEFANDDIEMVSELFPDFKNPESPLFKKAVEIFEKDKKRLSLRPDANSYCFFRAADALGIKPVTAKEETAKREIKIVNKPNLANLGEGGAGNLQNPIQNKLDWFNQREKQFVKK